MSTSNSFSRRQFLANSTVAALASPAMAVLEVHSQAEGQRPTAENGTTSTAVAPPVTNIVAQWVAASHWENIPDNIRKEAVRSVLNWVGVTIGGSREEGINRALQTLSLYSGLGNATLFGRSERLDPLRAALINGMSSHILDFDDTDLATIIHPAGPIAAALFALSEDHSMSGQRFLQAFVVGVEVECRLGRAIYPSHYDLGWHITGTCGVFGAAAACAKILDLPADGIRAALGIAATQAAGLKVMFGTMCKSFNQGRAAENGLLAALLAAKGFTSSEQALEGKFGYVEAASRQHNYDLLVHGLGEHYILGMNTYKPYPCGIVIHPAIDGILQLREEAHLDPVQVDSIELRANPLVLQLTGKAEPQTGLEGKFSVYHSVAVALVRGYAGVAEYSDEAVRDPKVIALRQKVKVTIDANVRSDEMFVTVTLKDGRKLERHVEHALGSMEKPLSDHDLETKFRHLAEPVLPHAQIDKLVSTLWTLAAAPDAAIVPPLARVKTV